MFNNLLSSKGRVFGLDFMRAFAISLVLWQHLIILVPQELRFYFKFYDWLNFEGVSIFFVLSGYLITRIILRDFSRLNKVVFLDFLNFWLRRWFRTLPAYFFVLLILIYFDYNNWENRWSFFSFTSNFISSLENGFFRVAWSLAVEEWYYIIFPVILWFFLQKKSLKNSTLITLIILVVFSNLLRIRAFFDDGFDSVYDLRQIVVYRLDAIAMGGVLAWISFYNKTLFEKIRKPFVLLFFIFLILNPVLKYFFKYPHSLMKFNLEALNAILTLPFLSSINLKFRKGKGTKFYFSSLVTVLSKISYSLYLVHASIVLWGIVRYIQNEKIIDSFFRFEVVRLLLIVTFIVLSVILSLILYFAIEEPFMKIRDRVTKK